MDKQNQFQITILLILYFLSACTNQSGNFSSYSDINEWVDVVKSNIKTIDSVELEKYQRNDNAFVLIDVRTREEHDSGYIPGSISVPRGLIEFKIGSAEFWEDEGLYEPLKDDMIILYCRSGNRSALAVESLKRLGYENVISLRGGYKEWKELYPDNIELNMPKFNPGSGEPIVVEEEAGSC